MAINRQSAAVLGLPITKAVDSVRKHLDQLDRKLTEDETAVFLGAFTNHIAPTFALKILEATVGASPTRPTKTKAVPESTTEGRGQFVLKTELVEKGKGYLTKHREALIKAIVSGSDTHAALRATVPAEKYEIACMVHALVDEGVIEAFQHRRTGKRPIQKLRMAPTDKSEAKAGVPEDVVDPALKERVRILVSTRGESFVFALNSGPLTCREMARKIAYSVEDTELLAQELGARGRIVVEQTQRDGLTVPLYSLPRPKPSPTLTVTHVEEKIEVQQPLDDEAWRAWANEKRLGSPNPLSFNQLAHMAHRKFGTTANWRQVFNGLSSLPSIDGRKPFKIDWDEELID